MSPELLVSLLILLGVLAAVGGCAVMAWIYLVEIRGAIRNWWRRRAGRCLHCGYDLTGNVSGICPECGTPVQK